MNIYLNLKKLIINLIKLKINSKKKKINYNRKYKINKKLLKTYNQRIN